MAKEEKLYTVEFLISKTVRVRELDDIQAELEAARKLTKVERKNALKLKILDVHEEYYSIDKEWWADNDILDKHKDTSSVARSAAEALALAVLEGDDSALLPLIDRLQEEGKIDLLKAPDKFREELEMALQTLEPMERFFDLREGATATRLALRKETVRIRKALKKK